MVPPDKKVTDAWRPARLIPTSGIRGADEQERRATSALLAVMMAVPEFARSLLKKVGAPAGVVRTFIEVPLTTGLGSNLRPDGVITVARGSHEWRALVEVKTGTRVLDLSQVEAYLDLAREQGFDALITISNQMTTALDPHPLTVDRRRTRKVALHHFSWVEILTEAFLQREFRGISDKDQAWILGELIAYLSHEQSGAMQFQDMGENWARVRDAARERSLRLPDAGVEEVVTLWDQFMQFLCLQLGKDLGVTVRQVFPRKQDASSRKLTLSRQLVDVGRLDGTLRVPRAAGDISIMADLRGRTVTVSMDVLAPTDRRSSARVTWLVRQLDAAPGDVRVEAIAKGGTSTVHQLDSVREDPRTLAPKDKELRSFRLSLMGEMGLKRSGVQGSFIAETTDLALRFYRQVAQHIKPWSPSPAKLPAERDTTDIATQPDNVVEIVAREEAEEARSDEWIGSEATP